MAVPPPGSSALKACATPAESFAGRSGNSTFASESKTTMAIWLSGCRRPIALTVACLAMSRRGGPPSLRCLPPERAGTHARGPPRAPRGLSRDDQDLRRRRDVDRDPVAIVLRKGVAGCADDNLVARPARCRGRDNSFDAAATAGELQRSLDDHFAVLEDRNRRHGGTIAVNHCFARKCIAGKDPLRRTHFPNQNLSCTNPGHPHH